MKKLFWLMSLLILNNAYAETDYTYCQKSLNQFVRADDCKSDLKMVEAPCIALAKDFESAKNPAKNKREGYSYYPFELTKDGKIKPHPSLNYKMLANGDEEIQDKYYKTYIKRSKNGQIETITSSSNSSVRVSQKEIVNAHLDSQIKLMFNNGKCAFSRQVTEKVLGKDKRRDVFLDTKLCRDVKSIFKKNPGLEKCNDTGMSLEIDNMFANYYLSNPDVYNLFKNESKNKKLDGYPGSGGGVYSVTPFFQTVDTILESRDSSISTLNKIKSLCENYKLSMDGFEDALNDESLWSEDLASSSSNSSKAISK